MLPEARDKRVNYELNMPSPPKPKRRGPLEFYEWIALIIFLMVFGAAIATPNNIRKSIRAIHS